MFPRFRADVSPRRTWLTSRPRGIQFGALALTIAFILSLALPTARLQAAGIQYYVDSVNGSDANPGTSPDRPWGSLGPVNGRAFQPGDVINFARGSTFGGGLVINASGTEGNPITFQAYGSGARPVFINSGQWARSIQVDGNWIVVQGMLLRDADEFGVRIGENATHNVVRDCEFAGVGIGVGLYGQHNLVTGSYFHDLKMVNNSPGGDDDYGAFAIGMYGSYNEVSYNRAERCRASSYDYGMDGGFVEFYNNVTGANIHHNWAQDNNGFIEVGGGSAVDSVVAYNVAVNNGTFGWFHLSGNFAASVNNLRVEHNTIVETAVSSNTYEVFGFSATPAADTFILRNNIFYVNQYRYISSKSGYTHDHNIYHFMQGGTELGAPLGQGEKIADPMFVDLAGGNYQLREGSPAIDAGVDLGYRQDHAGQAVPAGSAPDAGAFEYGAAAPAPAPTAEPPAPAPTEVPPTPAPTEVPPAPAPTETPADTPAEVPAEVPAETPAEAPADMPAEVPTEAPAEAPAETPTDVPAETPTDVPAEVPADVPAEVPADMPAETPIEAPAETPAEEPTEAPAEEPTEAPAETPTEAPAEVPAEAPTEAPAEAPDQAEPTPAPAPRPQWRSWSSFWSWLFSRFHWHWGGWW